MVHYRSVQGCISLFNTRKYYDNTRKDCCNANEYWANTWKMCPPASAILGSIVTILTRFEGILIYSKAYGTLDGYFRIDVSSWFLQKTSSKLLQNLQVLGQYSRVLHLQVNTFFKYWVNTPEYYRNTYKYCHNTCEYWAGEYTLELSMWIHSYPHWEKSSHQLFSNFVKVDFFWEIMYQIVSSLIFMQFEMRAPGRLFWSAKRTPEHFERFYWAIARRQPAAGDSKCTKSNELTFGNITSQVKWTLVQPSISWNFCQKRVKVNFRNFHSVYNSVKSPWLLPSARHSKKWRSLVSKWLSLEKRQSLLMTLPSARHFKWWSLLKIYNFFQS